MAKSLREELLGAWKLVSFEERPVDGSASEYPMTEEPMGLLLYTADGYVSAQLMRPGRKPLESDEWFRGSDEEFREEASGYVAYSGEFHVDEATRSLTHSMFVSLFPNWLGQTQPRAVRVEGDDLYLGSVTPGLSGGRMVMAYLHWRRVRA